MISDYKGKISIKVDGCPIAAQHFLSWLCESGEVDYRLYMEHREVEKQQGSISVVEFSYDFDQLEVDGYCGRLDSEQ